MRRRSFFKMSGCFGVAALASSQFDLSSQAAEPVESTMPIVMQLDWKFNVQFAGLLLADHLGLYQQRGLAVELKPWQSDMVVPEEVARSPMMIGCSEQNLILDAQAKDVPLQAIATMMQASPYALMTLPDRNITTLRQLEGERVGVHVDGVKVLELVKGVSGLATDAIEVVEIDYENKLERLVNGEFAAVQCYAVDEPIAFSKKFGYAPAVMPLDEYGYKAYAQVFFATRDLLTQQPDRVKAFLEASFEGWKLALADIPGTAKIVAEQYAEPGSKYTDVTYQQESLELVKQYILRGISEAEIGKIVPAQWQQTADLMMQYGIIEKMPDLETSLNLSLW